MKAFGIATLGGDMDVRFLPDGTPVGQLSLAFKLGKKGADGKYLTQWVSGSMFGKRVESLSPYMLKGTRHAFHLSDIHIDEYVKDGEKRASLNARIDDIEFGGGKSEGAQSAPARQAAPRSNQQAESGEWDGGDIPF
jgi:single-strand DNA-binding protein